MDYRAFKINVTNNTQETNIVESIYRHIDNQKSFVFDAGAGAGKTYTLVQTLQYLLIKHGSELNYHNQKIICITFTNVAANEVKARLGNTKLIEVCTIHNWIWEIISSHQTQLVENHIEKLKSEINIFQNDLDTKTWAVKYQSLDENFKYKLLDMMLERKDIYYKHKSSTSVIFNSALSDIKAEFSDIMSNVANFRKIVDRLFKIDRYSKTIVNIEAGSTNYKKVKYDARFNNDRLASMMISHDTLLEYANNMIKDSDMLKQIIFNKYPFILVDEYQDTDYKVISSLSLLTKHAEQIKHKCVIGYYGDKKQNIYDIGVGEEFNNIHKELTRVVKNFNRRSASEIINVANKIRNDDLEQISIYENFPVGTVNFYNIDISREEFINEHIRKWEINKNNTLHCFELLNENVAKYSRFGELYEFFKGTPWYKRGNNYKLLRDHILNSDKTKLGRVQSMLFRILDFKERIDKNETKILDILPLNKSNTSVDIISLRILINKFKVPTCQTFSQYIVKIFENFDCGDLLYDKCIEYIIGEDVTSVDKFNNFIFNELFLLDDELLAEEKAEEYMKKISDFLDLDMMIFELWYNFIMEKNDGDIIYHTYHGTKGKEFDNVIVFMTSKFGNKNTFFSDLLNVISQKSENDSDNIREARNLLYVAVTRAVKNISILYFDNINKPDEIEKVFGEIHNSLTIDTI